jgi:hypothetical protein
VSLPCSRLFLHGGEGSSIKPGDRVLEINGVPYTDFKTEKAANEYSKRWYWILFQPMMTTKKKSRRRRKKRRRMTLTKRRLNCRLWMSIWHPISQVSETRKNRSIVSYHASRKYEIL